jgi:hypothetical protein
VRLLGISEGDSDGDLLGCADGISIGVSEGCFHSLRLGCSDEKIEGGAVKLPVDDSDGRREGL